MDNWYTSLPSSVHLHLEKGIHCVGTVKANRTGLPKDLLFKKSKAQQKPRGTAKMYTKEFQYQSKSSHIYLICWQDAKPVHLLSTYKTRQGVCERHTKVNRSYTRLTIPRPMAIANYNSGTGGTDVMDQRLTYHRSKFRAKKLMTRIFIYFISVAAFNAYILYRDSSAEIILVNGGISSSI